MKNLMNILNKSVGYNLLVMLGIALLGFVSVTWGLDFYTHHGEKVTIPSLAGKPLSQAVTLLEEADLRYEVVDSVYDKNAHPGTIIEVYPEQGTSVKPNRIIFLKIYASMPPRVAIPHVKDMSARQAYALLKALGFENISQRAVPGDYIGSCQGIALADGRPLSTGDMLSKDTPIVLLVTGTVVIDSISVDDLMVDDSLAQSGVVTSQDSTQRKTTQPAKTDDPNQEPEQWW